MITENRLEFYEIDADDNIVRTLAAFDTEASPPLAGCLVNIGRVDYKVNHVDYSIDNVSAGPRTWRRNVYCRKVEE